MNARRQRSLAYANFRFVCAPYQESGRFSGGIRLRTVGLRLDKLSACLNLRVSSIAIYQLRVVLCGVSPLVWRRLLVVSTTSIAELHEVLQNAFGWSGEHLIAFLFVARPMGF